MSSRAVFKMLWKMANEIDEDNGKYAGTIISRYTGILDDRIENSGYSHSVDSLKLYSVEQLQAEIDERLAESTELSNKEK